MFCALLMSRYQVSVYRTNGPLVFAGNEDMYKSLNEFEIRPDATTGFHGNHRVIMGKMLCPL